ncbi:SLAM family member 5-like [Anomaloglossus baeobatrachus]|uniref:SLAM family member 5-like n=1 Tax=Anomaloglossus baeobatrachus TaxID=238106 RepID=UPI003F50C335
MKMEESMRSFYAPLMAVIVLVLGGEANIPEHRPALLHGSVQISYSPSQKMGTIQSISWRFDQNGKRFTILDTSARPYYIYDSQFRDRLLMSDDLYTMTIQDLTLQDAGVFTVDVADTNGRSDFYSFNVTVHEPVSHPSLITEVKENSRERCGVTLHCSSQSNTSDLSYAWSLSGSGVILLLNISRAYMQIAVSKDSTDMRVLCTVQNLADQKNVSVQLPDVCPSAEKSLHLLIIKPVQCALFTLPLILYIAIKVTGRKAQ